MSLLMSVDINQVILQQMTLEVVGASIYTLTARPYMLSYKKIGGVDIPNLWLEGDIVPQEIIDHIAAGGFLCGWNVIGFDRLMWRRLVSFMDFLL